MEYKSFNNSEEELLFFVRTYFNESSTWSIQYESDESEEGEDEEHRKI